MPDNSGDKKALKLYNLFLLLATRQRTITGTGFVAEHSHRFYLVACWHLLTQRSLGAEGIVRERGYPEEILIEHHSSGNLNPRIAREESLYDANGNPRWLQHPHAGVDVVALALTNTGHPVVLHPLVISMGDDRIKAEPGRRVGIVGYPGNIVRTSKLRSIRREHARLYHTRVGLCRCVWSVFLVDPAHLITRFLMAPRMPIAMPGAILQDLACTPP